MLDATFFYLFAAMTLLGALLTITRRSPVHSAIALIVSLMGVAGLYLLQSAEFLFAVQIVLYIGGIMVLFLFVIMLVNLDESAKLAQFNRQWLLSAVCLAGVAAEAVWFLRRGPATWTTPVPRVSVPGIGTSAGMGNTQLIADSLFGHYLLPFELASLLLLVAVVGSVFMARKERPAEQTK